MSESTESTEATNPIDPQAKSLENQKLQVEMARTRTSLALERTLLAWIRTALTMVAFGFTLAKFVHGLVKEGHIAGVQAHDLDSPHNLGLMMMLLGLLGLLGGTIAYCRSLKKLDPAANVFTAPCVCAITLSMVTVFLMALMMLRTIP